jgi:putative Holliday junction resolvase
MITGTAFQFRAAFPEGGRLAGLDVGTKTIGVAMCDAGWHIASPAETIRRAKFAVDRAILAQLLQKQTAKGIVVGLPLSLDGTDSPRTQSVRAFARNIETLGLPILLWDERWSTAGGRYQPRTPPRIGRQAGRRLYPSGRDRCDDECAVAGFTRLAPSRSPCVTQSSAPIRSWAGEKMAKGLTSPLELTRSPD